MTLANEEGKVDLAWDDGHVFPPKPYPDVAFLYRRMNEVALGSVSIKRGEVVLDIGCGRATELATLARDGGNCCGLEPSRNMLNLARDYVAENNRDVRLIQGTGEYLPFKTGSFDKVICKGALDHFPHPARAIEEIARILKPRGQATIAVTNFESLGFRLGRQLFKLVKAFSAGKAKYRDVLLVPGDHTLRFDYTVLKQIVEPHLKIEQSTGISLLFGVPFWGALLAKLPPRLAAMTLSSLDKLAHRRPSLSNVIVLTCRPR